MPLPPLSLKVGTMKNVVLLILSVGLLIVGAGLAWQGQADLHASRQLEAKGVTTLANVLNAEEADSLLGRRYSIHVELVLEDGKVLSCTVPVSEKAYVDATGQGLVELIYVPKDPENIEAATDAQIRWSKLVTGLVLLATGGLFLLVSMLMRSSSKSATTSPSPA